MLFSNEFIILELTETNQTTSSSDLFLTIKRKNQNYYNREGIDIVTREYVDNAYVNETVIGVWYTAFNPRSQAIQDPTGNDIEQNSVALQKSFQITNQSVVNDRLIGSKQVQVILREHNSGNDVLVTGTMVLKSLETPTPITQTFEAQIVGKTIELTFIGTNPSTAYTYNISQSSQIAYLISDGVAESLKLVIGIPEEIYNTRVYFRVEWYLDTTPIDSTLAYVDVPSYALGLYYRGTPQIEEGYDELPYDMYKIAEGNGFFKIDTDDWRVVEKVYYKQAGEWLSQN